MESNLAKLAEKIAEAARQGVQVERMWQQKLEDERKNQAHLDQEQPTAGRTPSPTASLSL